MAQNKVGAIPEFTKDDSFGGNLEEVKEPVETEVEKETPSEPPAEEKPALVEEKPPSDDPDLPSHVKIMGQEALVKAVDGLQKEYTKLLTEVTQLKGVKRQFKQEEADLIKREIDELKDIDPQDIALMDRVLRAKGYMTKEEAKRISYQDVQNQQLESFLERFPEYKPENDPGNRNWDKLTEEFNLYRRPDDPMKIGKLLERAHSAIAKPSVDRSLEVKKQQVKTASVGSGGVQRSSSKKSLTPNLKSELLRGGWSEEDVKKIENRL